MQHFTQQLYVLQVIIMFPAVGAGIVSLHQAATAKEAISDILKNIGLLKSVGDIEFINLTDGEKNTITITKTSNKKINNYSE
jgi:hypothetical protein